MALWHTEKGLFRGAAFLSGVKGQIVHWHKPRQLTIQIQCGALRKVSPTPPPKQSGLPCDKVTLNDYRILKFEFLDIHLTKAQTVRHTWGERKWPRSEVGEKGERWGRKKEDQRSIQLVVWLQTSDFLMDTSNIYQHIHLRKISPFLEGIRTVTVHFPSLDLLFSTSLTQ